MTGEQVSFKTRVKNIAIQYASVYYARFVCHDYLIVSDAFHNRPYYIISAAKDNFLHLIGVSTVLSANAFFDKCLNGTLTEDDFELASHAQNEKSSKGSIRRKINALPHIEGLISGSSLVEEDFHKNAIFCSLASTDGACTMGFISVPTARPKTLLIGDELDHSKAAPIKLILEKGRADSLFSSIIYGTDEYLANCKDPIYDLISDALKSRISLFLTQKEPETPASKSIKTV